MGQKAKEKIAMLEAKIKGLNRMLGEYAEKKQTLEEELKIREDEAARQMLESIERQIRYVTSQRDDAVAELEQEGLEEEKKKKEKAHEERLKAVYVFDQLWREENRQVLFGGMEIGAKTPEKTQKPVPQEEIVLKLFSKVSFVHVKPEQVEEILKNPEFTQKHYSTKLKHMDIETGLEYRRIVDFVLDNAGLKPTGDLARDEQTFARTMEKNNGFEEAIDKLLKRRHIFENNPKDLRVFDKILDGLLDVREQTRKAMAIFKQKGLGTYRDTGYTKEMIESEKKVHKLLSGLVDSLNDRMQKGLADGTLLDENGEDKHGILQGYAAMKEIIFPVERQLKIDECLQRNSELREKIEKWYIYEKIKGRQPSSVKDLKLMVEDEEKAWSKPARIRKMAEGKGRPVEYSADYALIETQMMLDRISENRPFEKKDAAQAKTILVSLIIHEIIKEEAKETRPEKMPYTVKFMEKPNEKNLMEMASRIAETPEFDKLLKKVGIKDITPQSCVKFLVKDMEKELSGIVKKTFNPLQREQAKAKEEKKEVKKEDKKEEKKGRVLEPMNPYFNS